MIEKTFESIEIGFENLESVNIPAEFVRTVSLTGITRELHNDWFSRKTWEFERASDAVIVLDKSANDFKLKETYNAKTIYERIIKWSDITTVEFRYFDQSIRRISVDWEDDKICSNSYQTTTILENGDLLIVVSKTREAAHLKPLYEPRPLKIYKPEG